MLRRTLATVGLLAAAIAVLLATGPLSAGPATAQVAAAQEKITFATDWKAQAEHGGFYQALATGLYKKLWAGRDDPHGRPRQRHPAASRCRCGRYGPGVQQLLPGQPGA